MTHVETLPVLFSNEADRISRYQHLLEYFGRKKSENNRIALHVFFANDKLKRLASENLFGSIYSDIYSPNLCKFFLPKTSM